MDAPADSICELHSPDDNWIPAADHEGAVTLFPSHPAPRSGFGDATLFLESFATALCFSGVTWNSGNPWSPAGGSSSNHRHHQNHLKRNQVIKS